MLFIESNNNQEQIKLSEEFDREDNLFAVPFIQTNKIREIIQAIKYQVFSNSIDSKVQQNHKEIILMRQLLKKVEDFVINALSLKFSLSTLRQIFQLIKKQEIKFTLYATYFAEMSKAIEEDQSTQGDQRNTTNLCVDFQQKKYKEEYKQQTETNQSEQIFGHCKTLQNDNSDNQQQQAQPRMLKQFGFQKLHSLKTQLPNSPKFTISTVADLNLGNLNRNKQAYDANNDETEIVRVEDQHIYKRMSSILSTEGSEKKPQSPQYLDSLSGRFHPLPSFLHDDSIGEMIAKEKKQDIRKSKILKQAIKKQQDSSTSTGADNGRGYSASMRAIKLSNKLRKNSRNSICRQKQLNSDSSKKSLLSNTTDGKFFSKKIINTNQKINSIKVVQDKEQKQKQFFGNQRRVSCVDVKNNVTQNCGKLIKSKVMK